MRRHPRSYWFRNRGLDALSMHTGAHVAGPVCDVQANPPLPGNIAPIGGALTPNMRAACVAKANDLGVPIGDTTHTTIDGVPVVLWVSCHNYTDQGGQQIPGAFHGCSVWRDLAPPPAPPATYGVRGGLAAVAILAVFALVMASGKK